MKTVPQGERLLESIGSVALAVVSIGVLALVIAPGVCLSATGGGLSGVGAYMLRLAFGRR
jgi:hypothetical protein